MKVADLKGVVFDEICIYREIGTTSEFEDLYNGNMDNVPADLLTRTVRTIGAKKKDILDINVMSE